MPTSTLRPRRALALVAVTSIALTGGLTRQEQSALTLLNEERSRAGLPALSVDEDAQAKAHAWAEKLAGEQSLSHSNMAAGIEGSWRLLGENVAMGGSIDGLHQALMGSAGHRARLLDSRFTHVGIGIARGADGKLYIAQVFVSR